MSTTHLDRRQLLKGLGVGALAAGAAAFSPASALADERENSVEGGWNLDLMPTVGSPRKAAANFAAGGAFTSTDKLPPVGAVGVGAWRQEEGNTFVFKFTVFDPSQNLLELVISGTGKVDGNSMSGTVSVTVFGQTFPAGVFTGTRMIV